MKAGKAGLRLAVFAALMVGVLVLVISAIERPISGEVATFKAVFTDASGLKTGDDVRMLGVQVGKVESIALENNQADVQLTVRTASPVYDNTKFAIRYQNLTGQRYVDVQQAQKPSAKTVFGSTIGVDRTVPSFDVTTLFNGLKPVLATLSPDALNRFTESMLAVIEGNGTGIGPALDAIGKLSEYAGNRQAVISTLIRNLSEISDKIGGRSPHLVTLLAKLADVFESLQVKITGLIDFAMTAPPVLDPIDRLLGRVGLTVHQNPDLDKTIRQLIPNPDDVVDILSRVPALLDALDRVVPSSQGPAPVCSKGAADLPVPVKVLVAGQRVTVCNQ